MAGNIAPTPTFPEKVGAVFERKLAVNTGRRGPLRFEEGVATDTDVPNEFQNGVLQGYVTPAGRPNHNQNVYEKSPEETMKERAHVGSAAWVEAPTFLSEFAGATAPDAGALQYEEVIRNGGRYERTNPATVVD